MGVDVEVNQIYPPVEALAEWTAVRTRTGLTLRIGMLCCRKKRASGWTGCSRTPTAWGHRVGAQPVAGDFLHGVRPAPGVTLWARLAFDCGQQVWLQSTKLMKV
jgi:hypothetical protein